MERSTSKSNGSGASSGLPRPVAANNDDPTRFHEFPANRDQPVGAAAHQHARRPGLGDGMT
jgi:hypothetical protein